MDGYKDILVMLDGAPPTRGRLELAAWLAERFAAHLIGLHLHRALARSARRRSGLI